MIYNQDRSSSGIDYPNEASVLTKLYKIVNKANLILNNMFHYFSMIILFFLMLLTSVDIIGRFFFNKPIKGTFELTGIMLALIIFFSLGTLQNEGEHIDIDFVTNKFSFKFQDVLQLLVSIFLSVFLILVTWQMFEFMSRI